MEPKRKLIGPVELVVFIIAMLLIAFILLKSSGGKVYERTESTQITENSQTGEGRKKTRNYEMQEEERVEVILQQLSENYTDPKNAAPVEKINDDYTISDDELDYFETIKNKYAEEENTKNPSDWLSILQASHKTYSKIKSVFEEADPDGKKIKENNISRMLENELAANIIYSKIEELFNIPQEDARAFSEQGKKAVSDWAEFVDQNQKKGDK